MDQLMWTCDFEGEPTPTFGKESCDQRTYISHLVLADYKLFMDWDINKNFKWNKSQVMNSYMRGNVNSNQN